MAEWTERRKMTLSHRKIVREPVSFQFFRLLPPGKEELPDQGIDPLEDLP